MKLLYILLLICTYSHSQENAIRDTLIQTRVNFYKNGSQPTENSLLNTFQNIQQINDTNAQLQLYVYYGLSVGDIMIYSKSPYGADITNAIIYSYKQSIKLSKKSKDSRVLSELGDFALLLSVLFSDDDLKYTASARKNYMYSLKYDKNNTKAKLGMGKWWAEDVITENNREFNHSFSQGRKYLSDATISELSNDYEWYNIDVMRAYTVRSLMYMRALHTEKALEDLNKASSLYPSFEGIRIITDMYKTFATGWI